MYNKLDKTTIGNKAELKACRLLEANGLQILIQNFKALPYGEIDIIALDKDTVIFIEVKYRKKTNFAKAEETVTYTKQRKIINTANIFLQKNVNHTNKQCRFDVIAINEENINWIKDAFTL